MSKGLKMQKRSQLLKSLIMLFIFGTAIVGCERRTEDQAVTQSSGAQSSRSESSGSAQSGTGATMQRAERAVDDSVITTKAKSALLADTTVKGSDIHVETNKGVVTLSGTVENERQRERAASIVRGLDGVKSVENKTSLK
jgi:hyperosmotically inducible protein